MLSALPELVAQWHPTKNGEGSPQSIGVSSKMKVWWLGECFHEWDASVVNRVNGAGCPFVRCLIYATSSWLFLSFHPRLLSYYFRIMLGDRMLAS